MIRHVCANLLMVLLLSGCGIFKPKPPPVPLLAPVEFSLKHYLGSPLSGARAGPIDAAASSNAAGVHARIIGLDEMHTDAPSFAASVRFISATREGQPVRATAFLTQGVRIALDDDAQNRLEKLTDRPPQAESPPADLLQFNDALILGATSTIELTAPAKASANPAKFAILLSQSADAPQSLQVALLREDLVTPAGDSPDDNQRAKLPLRELAVFDPVELDRPRSLLLLIPWQEDIPHARALAVMIQIDAAARGDAHDAAVRWALDDLKQSVESTALRPSVPAMEASQSNTLQTALEGIGAPERRRASLVFLATQVGARWCEDLALIGSDEVLAALAEQISASAANAESMEKDLLSGICDLSAFQLLARLQAEKKLTPELQALLARHAGEAGRHESSIEEIGRNLTSQAELQNRLLAENLIYLEDNSPAARVRAFDWLSSRGAAPADYDPLAAPPLRRAALEKAFAPAEGNPP